MPPIFEKELAEYKKDLKLDKLVEMVFFATQLLAPEKEETLEFLDLLDEQLVDHNAPLKQADMRLHTRGDVHEALQTLKRFAECDARLYVAALDRLQMACQLACRVYDIQLIDQGQQSLCGPNSFVYSLAQTSISAYVELAVNLLQDGRARINRNDPTRVIEVGDLRQLVPLDDSPIDDVDLVVLGSLRSSVQGIQYVIDRDDAREKLTGYTTPPQLVAWLRHAGYAAVEDHTLINYRGHDPAVAAHYGPASEHLMDFSNRAASAAALSVTYVDGERARRYSKANASLRECQAALRQGCLVFILHDARLSNMALGQRQGGAFDRTKLHWALLNSLHTDRRTVSVDLLTWGERSDINLRLPIDAFLEYWGGFVSARP